MSIGQSTAPLGLDDWALARMCVIILVERSFEAAAAAVSVCVCGGPDSVPLQMLMRMLQLMRMLRGGGSAEFSRQLKTPHPK